MRILITGITGFIGRKLAHFLSCDKEMELYGLSNEPMNDDRITFFLGDILNKEFVTKLFRDYRFNAVIHLAAITAHKDIVDNRWETFDINLRGTQNLLEGFNQYCEGGIFLYTSTGKVYGKTNEMPITEKALVKPTNILGKSKRITEEVIDFYAIPQNKYIICRIFNIYGEFQRRSFIVPTIIDQLGEATIKLGSLSDKRDYLYIDDLIEALISCIRYKDRFANVDHVNIGSGFPADVSDILTEIGSLLNRELCVETEESRLRTDETPLEYCSHEKLTELTGWQPHYTLHTGLKKTLEAEGIIPG